MNEIIKNNKTKQNTITTIEIAEMLGMKHYKVLEKLEGTKDKKVKGIIPVLTEHNFVLSDYFIISTYKDASGKENKCYLVTKLGCDFLANKFTGEKGILFTAKYVKRFDEMEQTIKNPYNLPTTYKEALIQLLEKVEENEKLILENNHKQEVINGLTDDIPIYEKPDIINRICRKSSGGYADRYKELYKCFRENFHIDLVVKCKNYNEKQEKKKDHLTVIRYAEKFGHIDDLYSCCVKLYESEVKQVIKELYAVQE